MNDPTRDTVTLVSPGPMKHEVVMWNRSTQEWFCLMCGRTSDHASEADARTELEQFECQPARTKSEFSEF